MNKIYFQLKKVCLQSIKIRTQRKKACLHTQNKPTANSWGKFPRQIATANSAANSHGKEPRQIAAANSHGKKLR